MNFAGVVEVHAEPFRALPEPDGGHALAALANGEIKSIDSQEGKIVEGGFLVAARCLKHSFALTADNACMEAVKLRHSRFTDHRISYL